MSFLQFSASHGATIDHLAKAACELRRGGRGARARALAAIAAAQKSNRRAGQWVARIVPESEQ